MRVTGRISACILGLSVLLGCAAAGAQDVVIVANKSLPSSAITSAQLRDVFIGVRSRLNDGTRAVPVLLKGGPAHEVFLRHHVGDSPEEFRTRWRKAVFTGQGSMPKECSSESELLDYVASTPGAIGYVSRVSQASGIRVLNVSP